MVNGSRCTPVNMTAALLSHKDDPMDPVSSELVTAFTNWKSTVIFPILMFFGVPTNILNMVVFYKHGLQQRFNSCLFCLSLVDLLYLVLMFFMYLDGVYVGALSETAPEMYRPVGFWKYFMIQHRLVGFYGLGWASMFVSTVIACERCVTVTWPLRAATLLKTRSTRIILFVGVVVVTSIFFVVAEKFTFTCALDVETGEESLRYALTEFFLKNSKLVTNLEFIIYGSVIPLVTVPGVTVATMITVVKLTQALKFRQSASSTSTLASSSTTTISPREVALTRMLVILSLQFILLHLPNVVYRIARIILPEIELSRRMGNLHLLGYSVVEICMNVSASTNVFVYYLAGTKYRATVHKLVKCYPFHKQAPPSQKFALYSVGATENTDDLSRK